MVSKNRSKEVNFGQSSERMDKYNHAANRTKVKNALLQFRRKKYLGLNDR